MGVGYRVVSHGSHSNCDWWSEAASLLTAARRLAFARVARPVKHVTVYKKASTRRGLIQVPRRRLGWLVTARILAALLPAAAPLETSRDGRWLRQLCTSDEPADVSVCDAYILGIFDSLARWGPAPRCMPAGVTDKQALSIVTTYLSSHSEDLLLPADLLVTKAISDAFHC